MCDHPGKLKVSTLPDASALPSSFRDPAGFLFNGSDGTLYRRVNPAGVEDYQLLMSSGLYEELCSAGLLIPHREIPPAEAGAPADCLVLQPDLVDFISYPYEWCFSQLQDAALATLEIQRRALAHNLCLKDASAYNIQFHRGNPLCIDTLSFTRYSEGEPWPAYRQFCQHFLAPLLLASYRDQRLAGLLRNHIDGIPLDLASSLLPRRTWLRYAILAHVHLHARAQQRYSDEGAEPQTIQVSRTGLRGLLDSLRGLIAGLQWSPRESTWGDYYAETNYSDSAMADKRARVETWLRELAQPGATLLDLGANTGEFSQLGLSQGYSVVAADGDPLAVERCYRQTRGSVEGSFLPLLVDLANPSPAQGWAHRERDSLQQRGPAHVVMALALLHHLAIGNNVPLQRCAEFFAGLGKHLVIEFVPRSDSQVKRLLASREDIFLDYEAQAFEQAFESHFTIEQRVALAESERSLYLLHNKSNP